MSRPAVLAVMANEAEERRALGARGQGRKPLDATGAPSAVVRFRVTAAQAGKLERLGGAPWLRERIDKAKEPA